MNPPSGLNATSGLPCRNSDELTKINSPIKYLDAPDFQKYWDADAKRLAAVVKIVGKVGK